MSFTQTAARSMAMPAPAGLAPNITLAPERSAVETRDAALLAAVARRDEPAFEALYRAHAAAVTAAARTICRSSAVAEDIAQRAFMALWERAPGLAQRGVRPRPWLITVARNAAIDHLRAESPYVPLDAAILPPDDGDCPQAAAVTAALMLELAPALAALPAPQRTVILQRYFEGQTFAAIAARTGEALGTVKSRARLAIETLRRSLADGAPHTAHSLR